MKKAYGCVLCVILLLTGCGRNTGTQNINEIDDHSLVMKVDSEERSFIAETWDTGITPDHQPLSNSFVLTEDALYYVDKSGGLAVDICEVDLSKQGQSPQRILRLEDGVIETIAAVDGTDGESLLALAGKDKAGDPLLAAYTMDGYPLWRQSYETEGGIALRLVQDGSGSFYVLYGQQVLWFDADGGCQGSVSCPGESYIDICVADGDSVYVSYRDGQAERPILARLQNGGLGGGMRISGNGYLGVGQNGCLLFQDGNEIYQYDPQRQEVERKLDLAAYDLIGEQVQDISMTSSGEIVLVSWELLEYDSPVWIARLKETAAGQFAEDGRQIVTWLVVGAEVSDAEQTAATFNRQSKDYKVVVEQVSLKGLTYTDTATQFDINEGIYMCVNTRLLASESADLISFLNYQDMERYFVKGYLEDLTPYITQSEQIRQEDYLEQVLASYSRGEALYSIPPTFGIDTLMGKESELGAEPGWTVEEFLDWLAQHPDAVAQEGLSKENVLDFCLKGTLDSYLNWETGWCDFEGEDFQELMRRIYELTVDSSAHWADWDKMLEEKRPVLEQREIGGFSNCHAWENIYGEPLVYKGYPSKDGAPCYYYTGEGLGILSRSTCKQGAYEFWEYYLLCHSEGGDAYYTDKEAYADNMARIADEQYAFTADGKMQYRKLSEISPTVAAEDEELEWLSDLTEEQQNKQLAMLEYIQIDTLDNQAIRNIIREEASGYFAGIKGLEDTCRVIQSRVSLYLAERV